MVCVKPQETKGWLKAYEKSCLGIEFWEILAFLNALLWSYYLFLKGERFIFLRGKIGVRLSARIAHSFIKTTKFNVQERNRIS